MSTGGAEHRGAEQRFWGEAGRQDTILHLERSGEDPFRPGLTKAAAVAGQTVLLFPNSRARFLLEIQLGRDLLDWLQPNLGLRTAQVLRPAYKPDPLASISLCV